MTTLELKLKANALRKEIVRICTDIWPGHIGGSLSACDVMTALYYDVLGVTPKTADDPDRNRFILSKGHCMELYLSILADKGFIPKEELATYCQNGTRLIAHAHRDLPGIDADTGALGHGFSIGCGLALAAKKTGRSYRTFVIIGDGELEEGSNWEAALFAAQYKLDNLCVILDRNHLQYGGATEDMLALDPLTDKWQAFGFEVLPIDGHDMDAILAALKKPPVPGKPRLILADTVKSKGVSFMEGLYKWHEGMLTAEQYQLAVAELEAEAAQLRDLAAGENAADRTLAAGTPAACAGPAGSPVCAAGSDPADDASADDPAADDPTPAPDAALASIAAAASPAPGAADSCRAAISRVLLETAKRDPALIVLTSDATNSCKLNQFAAELPKQFVQCGIAEQNEVAVAAGLALGGLKPVVFAPAAFLSARSYEQLKLDVSYADLNIKIFGVSAGVSYGPMGGTHFAVHDLAAIRPMDHMTVVNPADPAEAARLTALLLSDDGPAYMRMGRGDIKTLYTTEPDVEEPAETTAHMALGKAHTWHGKGRDLTIIATGEIFKEALKARGILGVMGIAPRLIDMHTIRPLDREAVIAAAQETGAILTVEEHSIYGGLGSAVAEVVVQECPVPMAILGLPTDHPIAGDRDYVMKHYGCDAQGIVKAASALLKRKLRNGHTGG